MRRSILAFGEILWDLLPQGQTLGGAPFNFAFRACGLGHQGMIVSRLGRDDLGRRVWDRVVSLGMDPGLLQWDDAHPTGTVQVSFDAANNPDYFIVPGVAYDRIECSASLLEAAGRADCICFGTLAQRAPTSRRTLGRLLEACGHGVKLLDVNLRKDCYCRRTVRESLERADVVRCNEAEASAMQGLLGLPRGELPEFCEQVMHRWPVTCCVVTLGPRGAYAASSDGRRAYVPGLAVPVTDTLGSGDAFTAGFVHRFLGGESLARCVELGNVLGAIVATQRGATQPIGAEEVRRLERAEAPRVVDARFRAFIPLTKDDAR